MVQGVPARSLEEPGRGPVPDHHHQVRMIIGTVILFIFTIRCVFFCKPYDEIISQEPCDPEWSKQQSSFHVPVSESAAIVQSVFLPRRVM